jgi:hypothetical protein
MDLKKTIKEKLVEGNYVLNITNDNNFDKTVDKIEAKDPKAVIKIVDEAEEPIVNQYIVTVEHNGKKIKIKTSASSEDAAKENVANNKHCPKSAILSAKLVEPKKIDEDYNIYAVCTKSTGKTRGDETWEACVKDLKGKKGYKLGESVNPKMTKQELVETVLQTTKSNTIKRIKVSELLNNK